MALAWLPTALEAIRMGLGGWYALSWTSLPEQCHPVANFHNIELETALTNVQLDLDDFLACRSLDMENDPWTMWFYNQFPTCVGFSLDPTELTCPTREMVCTGTPTNLTMLGSYGTFDQQATALLDAIATEELMHPLCSGEIPTITPTPRPTPSPQDSFIQGCTDPNAVNYNPTVEDDDGSCVYERTRARTDFGIEGRWWMNWRMPHTNVAWINKYSGSITTVHPAHNMLVVEKDGGYRMDRWFVYQDDITPYFALNVDVMPVVDFDVQNGQSAIYSAFILGDQQVLEALTVTARDLAEIAVSHNYSGYMLDYEPYWEPTVEHTQAYLSFSAMVKHAIDAVDNRIDPFSPGYAYRRVGICISDWGIIDATDQFQAEAYAKSNVDIFMSMGYTYFPPEDGDAGFAELRHRALRMKRVFANHSVTIGISPEKSNIKADRWYAASTDTIDGYIEFLHEVGIPAISVWGHWDFPPEDPEIARFAIPLDEQYLSIGLHEEAALCQPGLAEDSLVSVSLAYSTEIQSAGHVNPLSLRVSADGEWLYGCHRTCVAAPAEPAITAEPRRTSRTRMLQENMCDNATLVCAGEGGTAFGTEEDQLLAIAAAVANQDGMHPGCPLTQERCVADFMGNYWVGLAESASTQAVFPLDASLVGLVGGEWYYNCMRTYVGNGPSFYDCDADFYYCAGSSGDTYGYGQNQLTAVAEAVVNGGKHPLAPLGCDDNNHARRSMPRRVP